MHFMEPEFADLAIMAEGVIRCFPLLHEMTLRISRRNDGEYDFFASNPQDVFERLLQRFIERTNLHFLNIEMGQRKKTVVWDACEFLLK